jgi:hypothetical protein
MNDTYFCHPPRLRARLRRAGCFGDPGRWKLYFEGN